MGIRRVQSTVLIFWSTILSWEIKAYRIKVFSVFLPDTLLKVSVIKLKWVLFKAASITITLRRLIR